MGGLIKSLWRFIESWFGVYNPVHYGADPTGTNDSTTAFNNAASAAAGNELRVPSGTYLINATSTSGSNDIPNGGFALSSNTKLVMAKNAILKVIPNNSGTSSVIRVQSASNVRIIGGQILGDRMTHTTAPAWVSGTVYTVGQQVNANGYISQCTVQGAGASTSEPNSTSTTATAYPDGYSWEYIYAGEYGYGICLNGANNVVIENMQISNCWGDGIFIGEDGSANPCKNITLKNVISDNNRRQGMSLTHVDGFVADKTTFSNTSGTLPQEGVDIEPSLSSQSVKNAVFSKCRFENNKAAAGLNANGNSGPVNHIVVGDGCTFISNNAGIGLTGSTLSDVTIGRIIADSNTQMGISAETGSTGIMINGAICTNNGTNGIEATGGSSEVHIVGAECKGNTQNGIYFGGGTESSAKDCLCTSNTQSGIYVYSATDITIENCETDSNTADGIQIITNSDRAKVHGNKVTLNGQHGIIIQNSVDIQCHDNTSHSNSQTTSATYQNIYIGGCTDPSVQSNIVRKGSKTNLPQYGLYIDTNTRPLVTNNDCYTGGTTGGLHNAATGALFGAGNKNNDGTFSTTPN